MTGLDQARDVRANDGLLGTLEALRRRWLLVLGGVLFCVAIAIAIHERTAKTYKATASVAFQNTTLSDTALQVSEPGSGEPVRDAATEVLIAHSSEVAARVRSQLHLPTPPAELLNQVTVEAAPDADVLQFTASSGEPGYSARLANAFASQYIAFKASAQLASVESAAHQLQSQIEALPTGSAERVSLQQSLQRLEQLRAVAGGSASIIGRAGPPSSPSGMSLSTAIIIGVLIGLAVALLVVFLLESLDRRVKNVEELEREYRLPALTVIPQAVFGSKSAAQRHGSLESYRILRSALDFLSASQRLNTLLVTSAVSGEGKTTVAVDLAQAVALTGRNVVLAELDLRRPTFAQHFGAAVRQGFDAASRQGLTSVLAGRRPPAEMLVRPLGDLPTLSVLAAGALPPNPSELLGLPQLAEILAELSAEAMVIIDAPPLNPVADAQVLLNNPAIDAVLLVARLNSTTRQDVRRARAILDQHMAEPVGLAITGVRDSGRYGYEPYESISPTAGCEAHLSRPRQRAAFHQFSTS